MRILFQHAASLLLLIPLVSPAQQTTPAQAMAMQQYERTTPYIDLPIPQLTKAIKELNGLKIQTDSGMLDTILRQTGDIINEQLPRVPNLLCREEIVEETKPQVSAPTSVRISGSPGASTMQSPATPDQWSTGDSHRFEYIIRTTREEDGSITLEETRQGKGPAVAAPRGTGFAALWMIFAPGNRAESTFSLPRNPEGRWPPHPGHCLRPDPRQGQKACADRYRRRDGSSALPGLRMDRRRKPPHPSPPNRSPRSPARAQPQAHHLDHRLQQSGHLTVSRGVLASKTG